MAAGKHNELAYRDLGAFMGEPGLTIRLPRADAIWPPPDDDPPGLVWITDALGDAEREHDRLFALVDGQLQHVTRFAGPGLVGHWERSIRRGRLEVSPILLFRSLAATIAWARSLTDKVIIDLDVTEPNGRYQIGDRDREFPPPPVGLAEDWDRRYASV